LFPPQSFLLDIYDEGYYSSENEAVGLDSTSSFSEETVMHPELEIAQWKRKFYDIQQNKVITLRLVGGYANQCLQLTPENMTQRERILFKRQQLLRGNGSMTGSSSRNTTAAAGGSSTTPGVALNSNSISSSLLQPTNNNNRGGGKSFNPIPSITMANTLLELMYKSIRNNRHKKKLYPISSSSSNSNSITSSSTAIPATEEDTGLFLPICFHPMDDGGVRLTIANDSYLTKSLHELCKNNHLCALCFKPLITSKLLTTVKVNIPYTELTTFGVVSYELHRHCSFLLSKEKYFKDSDLVEMESLYGMKILETYQYCYDDIDDNMCSICYKPGAVLLSVKLRAGTEGKGNKKKKNTETSEGTEEEENGNDDNDQPRDSDQEILCHLICFHHLVSSKAFYSKFLELKQSKLISQQPRKISASSAVVEEIKEKDEEDSNKVGNNENEVKKNSNREEDQIVALPFASPAPVVKFHEILSHLNNKDNFRCMICGMTTGLILRCCGAGCHIRAHPICTLFTRDWNMIEIKDNTESSGDTTTEKKKRKMTPNFLKRISFVCAAHRIEVIQGNDEEVGYFEK
jgi:hypothetical protein